MTVLTPSPPHLFLQDSWDRQESFYPRLWTCEESPGWDSSLLSSLHFILETRAMPFRCPWCQSERTRRSKTRGFFEAFLAKLSVKPFRCHDCDCRFFRTQPNHKSNATPPRKAWLRAARVSGRVRRSRPVNDRVGDRRRLVQLGTCPAM
jgi:predicted Zn-ribbon and HTH transcriptional regulator